MTTLRPTYLRGPGKVHRDFATLAFTSTNAEATSSPIDIRPLSMGQIWPNTATQITWYGSESEGGTFTLIQDAGTAGVQTVAASKWNQIPAVVMQHGFIKAVSGTPGACVLSGKG